MEDNSKCPMNDFWWLVKISTQWQKLNLFSSVTKFKLYSIFKSFAKFIMVHSIHVCTCQISTLSGKTAEGSPEESGEES